VRPGLSDLVDELVELALARGAGTGEDEPDDDEVALAAIVQISVRPVQRHGR